MADNIVERKIRNHAPFIQRTLKVSIHLRQSMFKAGILDWITLDQLRNIPTDLDRVERLLDILRCKPVDYWKSFLQCLRDCGRADLAEYLSEDDDERPEPPTAEECVRPHSVTIIKRLNATPQVSRALHKENILDDEDIEHVENAASHEKGNDIIITALCRQTDQAWVTFIKILVENNQERLAFEIDEKEASKVPLHDSRNDKLEPSDSDSDNYELKLAEIERKKIELKKKKRQKEEKKTLHFWGEEIKKDVCIQGHIANRYLDRAIDLDEQFITLRLVGSNSPWEMDVVNNSLPDRYLDRLQKLDRSDIQMTDIIDLVQKNQSFLIYGRAGIGKSTLIQKLTRLWAQKKWARKYEAVFLFNIRSLTLPDRRKRSLIQFLNMAVYGCHGDGLSINVERLKRDVAKTLFFFDGIDEFVGFENFLNTIKPLEVEDEAEPIEWCVNFLRRNIMKDSTIFLASRPFPGLAKLHCAPIVEVVGLTRERILDFIDHHVDSAHRERVKRSMTRNPLVMSVSTITYFCMLFCQVLQEDEHVPIEELQTYTRIASFFIKKYLSRNPTFPSLPHVHPSSILPPLASLAYRGLVENRVSNDLARLVFDEADLRAVHLNENHVKSSIECGILLGIDVEDPKGDEGRGSHITSEFVHLTVQEMLAMLELHQKDEATLRRTARLMWKSPSFNMAKMYLYGIMYDKGNQQIEELRESVVNTMDAEKRREDENGEGNEALLMELTQTIYRHTPRENELLQTVQIAYETQNQELVGRFAQALFKDLDEMKLSNTLLTAIDMNAIIFMLRQASNVLKLRLEAVTIDETCIHLLGSFLKEEKYIKELSLEGTKLPKRAYVQILQNYGIQAHHKTLNLSRTGFEEDSSRGLLEGLRTESNITSLRLAGNRPMDETVLLQLMDILKTKNLTLLDLSDTGIRGEGLQSVIDGLSSMDLCDFSFGGNPLISQTEPVQLMQVLQKMNLSTLDLSGSCQDHQGMTIVLEHASIMNIQHLRLQRVVNEGSILAMAESLTSNYTLKTLDIRHKSITDDKVRELMNRLKPNQSLQVIWLKGTNGTNTLVSVPDTGRRVLTDAGSTDIDIYAWSSVDLQSSSVLTDDRVVWGGGVLRLCLDELSSIYGHVIGAEIQEVWSGILSDIANSTHKIDMLMLLLPSSTLLQPLLTSITRYLENQSARRSLTLIVCHGEVTCGDLYEWYTSLTKKPGWTLESGSAFRINSSTASSLHFTLSGTRIISTDSHQHQRHLEDVPGLLKEPEWIKLEN